MTRTSSLVLGTLLIVVIVGGSYAADPSDGIMQRLEKIEERLADQEARISKLENSRSTPHVAQPPKTSRRGGRGASRAKRAADRLTAENLIDIKISNKHFEESDFNAGIYKDTIRFDVTYTSHLKKKTRSVKGAIRFCDLFGESKLGIRVTINEGIAPDGSVSTESLGFDYNPFKAPHGWVRNTDIDDMILKFQVKSILYADGTREDFPD